MQASTIAAPRGGGIAWRRPSSIGLPGLAVAGGALLMVGAILPWLSLYGGLDTLRGVDGMNGRVLLAFGALAMFVGLVYAWRPAVTVRWGIGVLGFAAAGFGAWVVSQLLGTYAQLQIAAVFVPALGPGAFVALAGGLLVLSTLLVRQTAMRPDNAATSATTVASAPADVRDLWRAGVVAFLLGAGLIHFAVIGGHVKESALYGVFFVVAGTAQIAAALLLALRSGRVLFMLAAMGNALVIAVWAITRKTGLPFGPHAGVPHPASLPDVAATVQEALVIVLALMVVLQFGSSRLMRRSVVRIGSGLFAGAAAAATVTAIMAVQSGAG